jgi:hypothetical protein
MRPKGKVSDFYTARYDTKSVNPRKKEYEKEMSRQKLVPKPLKQSIGFGDLTWMEKDRQQTREFRKEQKKKRKQKVRRSQYQVLEPEEVEQHVFDAFSEDTALTFKELKQKVKAPNAPLKNALSKLCNEDSQGRYTLKSEYKIARLSSTPSAVQQSVKKEE